VEFIKLRDNKPVQQSFHLVFLLREIYQLVVKYQLIIHANRIVISTS